MAPCALVRAMAVYENMAVLRSLAQQQQFTEFFLSELRGIISRHSTLADSVFKFNNGSHHN